MQERAEIGSVEAIALGDRRKRSKLSRAKIPFLNAAIDILNMYKKFQPLTDRQIHYYLQNDPPLIHASKPHSTYANNRDSYKSVCTLLTCARLEGSIPFDCIHDPTRPIELWNRPQSLGPFIRDEIDWFLKGYYRDLMQSQPNHIEILAEKNTVASILQPVAEEFGIPMTIGRGYSSIPPRHALAERFKNSGKDKLILLIASDFDSEGEDIPESFALSMRDDFGIEEIVPIKVALTHEQVLSMNLAADNLSTPPKKSSSRTKKFVERYGKGQAVYELEAIPPDRLQILLREAILSVIDLDAFNAEVEREKEDMKLLAAARKIVKKTLETIPELKGP
jgi:hypothetical protein